ncbi:hypothetical protein [Saccharothrix sp. NRRL B-16314]|uniref:hypothetical protein n=1 Tax=Saccharothrix sp. NRRL B-16314 TaxID=1463825 RepID=UPI000524BA80|nr:hypothetical protein [Saccharothrix sp. NRRL B-16314]
MTVRSGRGTARQTIRVDTDLWDRFGAAAEQSDTDRSEAVRAFIRWYLREPGAKMPRRPDASTGDHGETARSD